MDHGQSLTHIVYASAADWRIREADIQDILTASRENNVAQHITGLLLYCDHSFLQVLEGPTASVCDLYDCIERDYRHTNIVKLLQGPIEKREFSDWSMGYAHLPRTHLRELPGCWNFFEEGKSFYDLEPGAVRKLLLAFQAGKWRQRIH